MNFFDGLIYAIIMPIFVGRFFGDTEHDVKGLTILLAYIAITEVQVWKFDGVREASLLRERLNNICRNIPPKT